MITALIIFVITYALISIRGKTRVRIGRSTAALLGAAAMVIFGVVSPSSALGSINYNLILLLLGVMALSIGLEYCGLFEIISNWLSFNFAPGPKLLGMVMVLNALVGALVMNDAAALLLTPVVIRCCASMNTDPIPYLMGTMMAANIGSLATAIGNPKNAYIVSEAGLSFLEFTLYQLPVVLLCLPAAYIMLLLIFRKRLTAFSVTEVGEKEDIPIDRPRLYFLLAVSAITFVGFAISTGIGMPMFVPAVIAGMIAVLVVMSKNWKRIRWMFARIDWHVLLFLIGLFVVMKGVADSGLLGVIADLMPGFGEGETPTLAATAGFIAILSNLVSNVPAVILIFGMVPQTESYMYTLAAASTLAGNATLLGSACNIIVSEKAAAKNIKINFWKHMAVGIPITVVTIMIQLAIHSLMF